MKAGVPVVFYPQNATEEAAVPTGALVVKAGETEVKVKASGGVETLATSSTVSSAVAAIAIKDWQASTAVVLNEVRRATATVGTIELSDLIRSTSARTTGSTFDATEAGNWTEFSQDLVTSVAGRTGTVVLAKADVGLGSVDNTTDAGKPISTTTQTALDAKQATLISGTNLRPVNGASLLGAANLSIAADLPGGTPTTLTNEGLATTGSPTIDTTTVPGETIIRWTGAGSLTVPLGVTAVRALVVGPGGGGGGGESNSFGGAGGGGGGGRVRDVAGHVVTPLAVLSVTVPVGGAGGTSAAGDASTSGATGASSVFGSLTSEGGGGGHGDANSPADTGYNGGGGSGDNGGGGLAGGTGSGGFAGGAGHSGGRGGGGGGGAGGIGEAANTDGAREGGDGGIGSSSDITGVTVVYGGGAGGGANSNGGSVAGGTGGSGGGGAGDTSAPNNTGAGSGGAAGTANSGGGGGGGCGRNGFAGGSGVVIARFATQTRSYQTLQSFANDGAAATGGILVGQFYRDSTSSAVRQRVS